MSASNCEPAHGSHPSPPLGRSHKNSPSSPLALPDALVVATFSNPAVFRVRPQRRPVVARVSGRSRPRPSGGGNGSGGRGGE